MLTDDIVADLQLLGNGLFDRHFGHALERLHVEEFDLVAVFQADPNSLWRGRLRGELAVEEILRSVGSSHAQHGTILIRVHLKFSLHL